MLLPGLNTPLHTFSRSRGVEEGDGEEAAVGEDGGLAELSMDSER